MLQGCAQPRPCQNTGRQKPCLAPPQHVEQSAARKFSNRIGKAFSTFGKEPFGSAAEKAVALIESILPNHPFIDRNKRTGNVLMRILLPKKECDFNALQE